MPAEKEEGPALQLPFKLIVGGTNDGRGYSVTKPYRAVPPAPKMVSNVSFTTKSRRLLWHEGLPRTESCNRLDLKVCLAC